MSKTMLLHLTSALCFVAVAVSFDCTAHGSVIDQFNGSISGGPPGDATNNSSMYNQSLGLSTNGTAANTFTNFGPFFGPGPYPATNVTINGTINGLTSITNYAADLGTTAPHEAAHTYNFHVTLSNNSGHTIHELAFQLFQVSGGLSQATLKTLNLTPVSGNITGFYAPGDAIYFDPNLLSTNTPVTYDFSMLAPSGLSGNFDFTIFAAAPEPGSIILGTLGMVMTGGISFMRRRKQAKAEPVEAS